MKSIISSIILLTCVVGGLAAPQHRGGRGGGHKAKNGGGNAAANNNAGSANAGSANSGSANSGSAAAAVSESTADAAANWAKDTAVVSNFLNLAPTLKGQAFLDQAQIALDAENNELVHKAVLDADPTIASLASVQSANGTLVGQGTFQKVVDLLAEMSKTGDSVGVKDADAINLNRCANVLPSIDAYLAAAGTNFKATRPFNCNVNSQVATGAPGTAAPFGGENPDDASADDTVQAAN